MSLKAKNFAWLAPVVLLNAVAAITLVNTDGITWGALTGTMATTEKWLTVLLSTVLIPLLAGLLSADVKAKLLFCEHWRNPLPGCRVYSQLMRKDDRIDPSEVEKIYGPLPQGPSEQNAHWYKIYSKVKNEASVKEAHQRYLLYRDYFGIAFLALASFLAGGWCLFSCSAYLIESLIILGQLLLTGLAARSYAKRFVTTALAVSIAGNTAP